MKPEPSRTVAVQAQSRAQATMDLMKFARGKPEETTRPMASDARMDRQPETSKTSVISAKVEIHGTINSPDEMHVFGKVMGDIRAAALVVRPGGVVTGDIFAESVVIHGRVDGRIHGRSVQLAAGGVVKGDILHAALGIDPAALFEGASIRSQDPLKSIISETPMTEAANAA